MSVLSGLPEGWVISFRPVHPALLGEADFIAVQQMSARNRAADLAGRLKAAREQAAALREDSERLTADAGYLLRHIMGR